MEKAPLAVQLGVGDDGQIIFKANAVREPPHRTAEPMKARNFRVQSSEVELCRLSTQRLAALLR